MCWIIRAGLGWAVPAASSVLFIVSNSHLVRFSQPVCVSIIQFSLHLDAGPGLTVPGLGRWALAPSRTWQ